MITYYSKKWLEACKENMNNSDSHLKKAKKLNGRFAFRVWDGPDGKDRAATWTMENGRCSEVTFGLQPAPWRELRESPLDESCVARFSCPFDMMARLNKGEVSPLKALASPSYQVEGKKTQLFKMMQGINSWNEHNAQVECDYDFTDTDDEGDAI
jgi:hypothetical protein